MAMQRPFAMRARAWFAVALAALCAAILGASEAGAQNNNGFVNRAVGGIFIDAIGALNNAHPDDLRHLSEMSAKALEVMNGDIVVPTELRKISLARLQRALRDHLQTGGPIPDEIRYLAGLQRIRYIFLYPEQGDIVLVGFGEGWRVDERGNVVGQTTGRPVLLLDDLLIALRTAEGAAQGGITCSIDPTADGLRKLQSFVATLSGTVNSPQAAEGVIDAVRENLGPQTITVSGVPESSHFARVLVAADYRMKRLAMDFEASPVAGMPSYLKMIKSASRGIQNMLPRWWLASDYEPLLTDGKGLAWELRGKAVRAMTEDDYLAADGSRKHTGKASKPAQKWADNMNAHYDELSVADPIFGELRNCMDLAVVAALVVKENLAAKAGCDMSLLLNPSDLPCDEFAAPRQVATQASVVETRKNFIISASGGVQLNSWGAADRKEISAELSPVRAQSAGENAGNWWWN